MAFDMEENQPEGVALVGSSSFVKALDGKKAYEGLYNLEMVGYTAGAGIQTYPMGFLPLQDLEAHVRSEALRVG